MRPSENYSLSHPKGLVSMNNRITALIKNLMEKLLSSLRRFPVTILLAALMVSVLIYVNHMQSDLSVSVMEMLERIAMVLALGIPVTLCIKTLFERAASPKGIFKALAYAGAAAALLLYYLFLLEDFEMVTVTRYIAISLALYLAFTFIPYFFKRENYELYVIKLFTSFFITYLYSVVLFLGLVAMLFTVDTLFALEVSEKLYFDIWLIVAGVFAPAYFLADIPKHRETVHDDSYYKVLRILLLYIVMPLLIAYSAILYVYFAKILFTRQWPDGMVSHLVLWYSIISVLVLFFIYPLRKSNQWVGVFRSYFPRLMLPLLAMMFVSMGIRINAYGITENRYFVMAAGFWVTVSMLYYVIKRDVRNIFLPVSLALIAALSVTGPWGAYGVSKLSQNDRFESILKKYEMISNGSMVRAPEDLPDEDKREISAIIRYFDRYHSLEELGYLPEGFTIQGMEELLGFKYNYGLTRRNERDYFYYRIKENDMLLGIQDYDYFADINLHKNADFNSLAGPLLISYSTRTGELQIFEEGHEVYSANLPDTVSRLYGHQDDNRSFTVDEMSYKDTGQNLEVLYVFKSINGWEDIPSGQLEMGTIDFYIFIKTN